MPKGANMNFKKKNGSHALQSVIDFLTFATFLNGPNSSKKEAQHNGLVPRMVGTSPR